MSKQYTPEEREIAALMIAKRVIPARHSEVMVRCHALRLAKASGYRGAAVDIQCELNDANREIALRDAAITEVRELLGDCVYSGDWEKLNAWLSRNPERNS